MALCGAVSGQLQPTPISLFITSVRVRGLNSYVMNEFETEMLKYSKETAKYTKIIAFFIFIATVFTVLALTD